MPRVTESSRQLGLQIQMPTMCPVQRTCDVAATDEATAYLLQAHPQPDHHSLALVLLASAHRTETFVRALCWQRGRSADKLMCSFYISTAICQCSSGPHIRQHIHQLVWPWPALAASEPAAAQLLLKAAFLHLKLAVGHHRICPSLTMLEQPSCRSNKHVHPMPSLQDVSPHKQLCCSALGSSCLLHANLPNCTHHHPLSLCCCLGCTPLSLCCGNLSLCMQISAYAFLVLETTACQSQLICL